MDLGTFLPARNSWSLGGGGFHDPTTRRQGTDWACFRESKLTIEAERLAREAKTARLREQRLSVEVSGEQASRVKRRRTPVKKVSWKIIEVD